MPRKEINPVFVGQRFGRFVIESVGRYCLCLCDCGTRKDVRRDHLKTGMSQSCGCLHSERSSARTKNLHKANTRHGESKSRLYSVWQNIKGRCHRPEHKFYQYYGARGIEVSQEWRESFEQFIFDMGERPDGMTLERIDNNRGYSKENCRWATRKEQSNNTRANRRIEHDGMSLTITEWAIKLGIHRNTLNERLRSGWSIKSALCTPIRKRVE